MLIFWRHVIFSSLSSEKRFFLPGTIISTGSHDGHGQSVNDVDGVDTGVGPLSLPHGDSVVVEAQIGRIGRDHQF